jgi:hypothetical protein
MTLYERAVDLQVKLEAARSADSSEELLAKGARMAEGLDRAAEYLEGVAVFRTMAGISDGPTIDQKGMTQGLTAFRAGLSRHGPAALQHQPAATLLDLAKSQRDRAAKWVGARWREYFVGYQALLERVETEHLVGSGSQRLIAQARASRLRAARGLDPVADKDQIEKLLGGTEVVAWLDAIERLGSELCQAIEALDDERAAYTSGVREALHRAASEEGLPLSEVTPETLTELRAAGVDEHLVVRRR